MPMPPVYDPSGQAQRRQAVYDYLLPLVKPFFSWEDARVVDRFPHQGDNRLRLWIAGALLAGTAEDQALANGIIQSIYFNHACHFCMAWTFSILHRSESLLAPETVAHLETYVKRYLVDDMTADYHFHGANDNAPAECATAIALAGERFELPAYVEFARTRLADMDFVLDRRGSIFENNSPTYSPATLTAFADLAAFAQDEQIARIALRAEQRIWQEIALAFHPATRQQMGPHSRAYEDDLLQQGTDMTYALYTVVGDIQPTHPLNMLGPEPVANCLNHNDWNFGRASALRSATPDYHPAPETVALFHEKPYPLRVRGTNEYMGMSGLPGGVGSFDQYFTEHWGLGTFHKRVWTGTCFSFSYRRRPFDPQGAVADYLASVRHVWTRYVVSEAFNGMMNRDPEDPGARNREFVHDGGAAVTLQQEGTAVVLYRPVNPGAHLTGGKFNEDSQIRTLKLSVVFPLHHSNVDEVWVGDRQYLPFSASVENLAPVYVKDGPVFMAFRPLVLGQDECLLAQLMLETQDLYGMISFFNRSAFYGQGWDPVRHPLMGNGFVFEVGTEEEWGSFEAFRWGIFAKAEFEDFLYGDERRTAYRREGRDLALAFDVRTHTIRYATVDRRPVSSPQLETEPPVPLVGL